MFLRMSNVGIGTQLVLAAGAILGLGAPALADGPDVSFSIRIGSGWEPACVVRPAPECDYAGTLTIDGRRFRIDTSCSVREQIRRAFECMGYDAWYVGRSVRVRTAHCDGPEVCWRNGEYTLAFRERHNSITITPLRVSCDDECGRDFRYGYDRGHGRYYTYSGLQAAGGEVSWTSLGVSTFVDNDRDLDDEVGGWNGNGGAGDDRSRLEPDDRRVERRGDSRPAIDDRSSAPSQPRTDARRRTDGAERQPVTKPSDFKRSAPPLARNDEMKALPSDRVGNLKRAVDVQPPQETKKAPAKKDGAKPAAKAPEGKSLESKPASKVSEDKKGKW